MAPWTALNIEPESDIEDVEYDDTKEIQIEEALKLYQSALKLHSLGPRYHKEALEAYDTLFKSEIFQYPESQSALAQLASSSTNDDFEDEGIIVSTDIAGETDTAPSTLPQILYLSFKNRATFELDRFLHQLRTGNLTEPTDEDSSREITATALELLSSALDKDPSDPDLWRQFSALSVNIGSQRLARFGLESATAFQEQEDLSLLDGPSLDALATEKELEKVLASIEHEDRQSVANKYPLLAESFTSWRSLPKSSLSANSAGLFSDMPASGLETLAIHDQTWHSVAQAILAAHERDTKNAKYPLDLYTLQLKGVGERTSEMPGSPVLVTSESLSKHRLSKSTSLGRKSSFLGKSEEQTMSPVFRTKTIESVFAEEISDTGTANDGVVTGHGGQKPKSTFSASVKTPMKRDSELAGLHDTPDSDVRSRSKRLRAKAETAADETPDPRLINKQHEEQLGVYSRADDWVFSVAYEIGCRFGCKTIDSAETIRNAFNAEGDATDAQEIITDPEQAALNDFRRTLGTWDANRSNLLLNGTGTGASAVLIDDGSDSGFASFMERSQSNTRRLGAPLPELTDQGLSHWSQNAGETPRSLEQFALSWARMLLEPKQTKMNDISSPYTNSIWSPILKDVMNQILVSFDETICSFVSNTGFGAPQPDRDSSTSIVSLTTFVQSVFELHIDIYSKMVAADSKADQPSRVAQKDRLCRWASLANGIVKVCAGRQEDPESIRELGFRHIWAQVLYVSLVELAARDHLLLCYQDLQNMFEIEKYPAYILPNNSTIPEVSSDALQEELSKEKTMEFFQKIFGAESTDPITLIENLEPVLMQTFDQTATDPLHESINIQSPHADGSQAKESKLPGALDQDANVVKPVNSDPENSQLIEFLQKATIQLRLSLWHQLKGAYNRIDYPGMKVVCNFRSMTLILREIHGIAYAKEKPEDRVGNFIIWLRNLADLVSQTLDTIKSHAKAFDCFTEGNIELALEACSKVTRLFHVFALWEDSIRIGQVTQPASPGVASTYKSAMTFLREMQPKVWHLLYLIYREAFSQHQDLFAATTDELIEFLRAIHCSFGNREYCRVGRKGLMRFMKSELLRLQGPEEEIAQALYDLYGLKITQNPNSIWEHGCTGDTIDRASALENVEYVVNQAVSMTMRDLLKSDIRIAAEKMQAVIGIPRVGASSTQQSFNRRLVVSYLKSPILANELFQSLRGLQSLTTMAVKTDYANIARKKWFFLIGWIHLAKYRTTKRVGPDASGDLDNAITFLKLDLDFDASNWETWMRLAQAHDLKLDDSVLWDAANLNGEAVELTQLERSTIHCYEMAVSLAQQSAEPSKETQLKLSELYSDFANRLYSSTREPFSGKVFSVTGHERFVNQYEKGTYQIPAYTSLHLVTVWKACEWLYQKALQEKLEDDWYIWYMRGKCRWKLWRNSVNASWEYAVDAFIKAVQQVPEKRDSRHPEKEPILEPHFKLLSVVHKLLRKGVISPTRGIEILENSSYTKRVHVEDVTDWKAYILELLQVLRNADKSNWHHRMIAKAVYIAYEDDPERATASQAAKDKLSQHILTKAMSIQIWKPEYERPGRHFVYTSRYLRFIVRLLEQLGDRFGLETVGKRVRKKLNEYIDAADIFDQICEAHMRLIRTQGSIPDKSEERVFHHGMTFEYFTLNAGRLETWAHSQLSLTNPTFALLSEVWELKRLSGSLLEKGPFEELMMDIYACLFERIVPELITRAGEAENRERMRIDRMLMDTDAGTATPASANEANNITSRVKQISRAEVRRRSEGLVLKPPVVSVKTKTVAARDASPEIKPEADPGSISPKKYKQRELSPVSIHDDADAESELSSVADSDIEEMEIAEHSKTDLEVADESRNTENNEMVEDI